MISKSYHV